MTPSEQHIVVARACPSRMAAIDRLMQGQLGSADREALERHILGCTACHGYREWLRAEYVVARKMVERQATQVALECVRRDLEHRISRFRASEAAGALTELARWHLVRRENADTTVYAQHRPQALSVSTDRAARALQRLEKAPGIGPNPLAGIAPPDLDHVLAPGEPPNHRLISRQAVDLALEIDPKCYHALLVRGYLIREADYAEMDQFAKDLEALLASSRADLRAQALALRAVSVSMVDADINSAISWVAKAVELDPSNLDHAFNGWLFSLVAGNPTSARAFRRSLLDSLKPAALRSTARTRAFTAAIRFACEEGHLAAGVSQKCLKETERLFAGP
ncbi:MAG: hypothetical protein AB1486_24775 [Planctomycetota bacterium]